MALRHRPGDHQLLAVRPDTFAAQAVDPETTRSRVLFIGHQENVALRFGDAIGILVNLFMVLVAVISIMFTVPGQRKREEEEAKPEVPAAPSIGS